MLTLFLALVLAQPPQAPPVAKPPQAPPIIFTYAQGCDLALKTNTPLWTYVGLPSVPSKYNVVCEAASLPGYPARCIVVGTPRDGVLYWMMTLDENGKEIRQTVADPFRRVQSAVECSSGG